MNSLRRLRRLAAGRERTRSADVFRTQRQRFDQSVIVVRAFYAAQLYHLHRALGRWNEWLEVEELDGLWPLFWGPRDQPQLTVTLVLALFAFGLCAATLRPRRRLFRVLDFSGLLLIAAVDNSFGKIDHGHHAWIYVAFVLIFLPDGDESELARSISARQRYLLVVAGAQAAFLTCYSLAGFWKIVAGIRQASAGYAGAFSPDALAYLAADRLLQTSSDSALGPLIIENPELGWPFMLGGIYVETFALLAVFRPSLLRFWGWSIVALHLGSLLVLTVGFLPNVLLAAVLLIAAPGATVSQPLSARIANLPLLASGVSLGRRLRNALWTARPSKDAAAKP